MDDRRKQVPIAQRDRRELNRETAEARGLTSSHAPVETRGRLETFRETGRVRSQRRLAREQAGLLSDRRQVEIEATSWGEAHIGRLRMFDEIADIKTILALDRAERRKQALDVLDACEEAEHQLGLNRLSRDDEFESYSRNPQRGERRPLGDHRAAPALGQGRYDQSDTDEPMVEVIPPERSGHTQETRDSLEQINELQEKMINLMQQYGSVEQMNPSQKAFFNQALITVQTLKQKNRFR